MKIKNAFTLIEILVVTTIIVLLTATAVVTYSGIVKQGRDSKRKGDLAEIAAALEMYRSNNDTYPLNLNTLTSGTVYLQSVPDDPKDPTYTYKYTRNSASDYILGTYLEGGGTTCIAGQCGGNCNYCLGPYGQK